MSFPHSALIRIAHQNAVVEAGLRSILDRRPEFEVLPTGVAWAPAGSAGTVQVVVGDTEAALQAVRLRRERRADFRARVMIVSTVGQDLDVRGALEAGVDGYVIAGSSADDVVKGVTALAAGRRYLCRSATIRMADSMSQPSLTLREIEVLELVSRGKHNKEVARTLGIALGTVKSHMRALLGKLDARCRTEALWVASQRGLVVRPAPAMPTDPT